MALVLNYVLPLIVSAIFVTAFVLLSLRLTKGKDESKRLLPIRILWLALVICEIGKIFYLIGEKGEFVPSRYPIVFCSLIMFACPLYCFKENKLSRAAKSFSIMPSFIVTVLFIALQYQYKMSLIQGHSYFYHASMTAIAIYLLASKLYTFRFRDFFPMFLILSGYILICNIMSLFLGADLSYFGPECNELGIIYKAAGYSTGNLLLVIALFAVCAGAYALLSLPYRKRNKENTINATVAGEK